MVTMRSKVAAGKVIGDSFHGKSCKHAQQILFSSPTLRAPQKAQLRGAMKSR
jgi:hypothetical protein